MREERCTIEPYPRPTESKKCSENEPNGEELEEPRKTHEYAFPIHQRVALHFHINEELHSDSKYNAPYNTKAIVTDHMRPQHHLATPKAKAKDDKARSDELPERRCFGKILYPKRWDGALEWYRAWNGVDHKEKYNKNITFFLSTSFDPTQDDTVQSHNL